MYRKDIIFKWTIYAAALAVVFIIQVVFAGRIRISGIAPNLLPVAVVMVAVLEGAYAGAGFGLAAGFLYDAAVYGSNGFFPVMLMITGIVIGGVADYIFKKNFLTAIFWTSISLVFISVMFFLCFFLFTGRAGVFAFLTTAVPEIFYSLFLSPPIYLLMRGVYNKTTKTV